MLSRVFAGSAFLLLLGQCFAASVATVSSRGSVTVSGIQVPTERLISWPISATDEIATAANPAVIRFVDGSVLTLQRNSKVKLDASPAKFSLLSGAAIFDGRPRIASLVSTKGPGMAAYAQVSPASVARYSTASATAALAPPVPASYAAMYQSPGSQQYYVAPNALTSGTFIIVGHAGGGPGTPEIVLPNGIDVILTPTTTNGVTTYTIASFQVPVTAANGTVSYLTVTPTSLVGATINISNPTPGASSTVTVTENGSNVTSSVAATVQAAATAALPGSGLTGTVATVSPISVGTFSSTAP
jgi:hypothetical protein